MIRYKDRVFMKAFIKACTEGDAKRDKDNVFPADVKAIKGIKYGEDPLFNILDLYLPNTASGKLPVLVSFHGGGYCYGDKELYRFYTSQFCHFGFAVINFNYTLAPKGCFPKPIEDVNMVMKWLCDNADSYGLDKENVVMIGDSAGAQLTSQYAAAVTNPEYAKLMNIVVPNIKLRAISLGCGLYSFNIRKGGTQALERIYLAKDPSKYGEKLDVLGHITADYPPTFLMSSPGDYLVDNMAPMYEFLNSKGIEVTQKLYGDMDTYHVFFCDMNNEFGKTANIDQAEFLKAHVKD